MNKWDHVVLVTPDGESIGTAEKLEAHTSGKLHRAFSVFIFNDKGEMLLQQRALEKYHSGGLWTNTCCSHPRQGKVLKEEAESRLLYEMGISASLEEQFSFIYKAELDNDLTEYEYDHVFTGYSNESPGHNPEEVAAWRWIGLDQLRKEVSTNPENFTYWFRDCLEKVLSRLT